MTGKVVRILNIYEARKHPNDGRLDSDFIVQALRGEDITIYRDGLRRVASATWSTSFALRRN